MICCIGLAGLYYFLHSPFLALMEILIYVGAVCVTIVFASCSPNPTSRPPTNPAPHGALGGAAVSIRPALRGGVAHLGLRGPWPEPAGR
jgi:NADH:ubiquinone oxidoreductase subunit 6 (subunit J)